MARGVGVAIAGLATAAMTTAAGGCNQILGVGAIERAADATLAPDATVDAAPGPMCRAIADACHAAQASDIGGLLAPAVVHGCLEAAARADEDACAASQTTCDAECALPTPAPTTESVFHCWQESGPRHRLCFGMSYVPGATSVHAYAAWTVYTSGAKPAASDVYEIFAGRPGLLELYDFAGTSGACLRVLMRPDALFVSAGVASQAACNTLPDDALGPPMIRLDRVP